MSVVLPNSRREFLFSFLSAAIAGPSFLYVDHARGLWADPYSEVARLESRRFLGAADMYLRERPETITALQVSSPQLYRRLISAISERERYLRPAQVSSVHDDFRISGTLQLQKRFGRSQ